MALKNESFFEITGSGRFDIQLSELVLIFQKKFDKWSRFRFDRKSLKIPISFITSGDDRKWRQRYLTYLDLSTSQVYHP